MAIVAFLELGNLAELAGEDSAGERAVVDDPDVVVDAVLHHLALDVAFEQGVVGLQAHDVPVPADLIHLSDVEVRHTEIAELARLLRLVELGHRLVHGRLRVRPMDLVEVDGIDAEPPQGVVDFLPHRIGLEVPDEVVRGADDAHLGTDGNLIVAAFNGPPHHFLRVPCTVGRRCVDEGDPCVDARLQGPNRLVIVHFAPEVVSEGPGAHADCRDAQIRCSELSVLHTSKIPRGRRRAKRWRAVRSGRRGPARRVRAGRAPACEHGRPRRATSNSD